MEETKENIFPLDTKRTMGPSQDLNKISEIEKSIQNMKMHLSFLSKQEEVQEKKINVIYNNSLQVATNKINNISSHLFVSLCLLSKNSVKEVRLKIAK